MPNNRHRLYIRLLSHEMVQKYGVGSYWVNYNSLTGLVLNTDRSSYKKHLLNSIYGTKNMKRRKQK